MIYSQRDPRWANHLLGKGIGGSTIGHFGCLETALADGMLALGYSYDPGTLSDYLLQSGMWDNNNYIKLDQLATNLPGVFTSFRSFDPWSDMTLLASLLTQDCVVICRVDARAIGGSGTHFVRAVRIEGQNVIINDPWTGDQIKVAQRYNTYGNILGLRVIGVKPVSSTSLPMPTNDDLTKILTHYNVKTADEFIASNDQQLQYLTDARSELSALKQTLTDTTKKHFDFVQKLIGILNPFGNPLGLSDDDLTINATTELVKSESQAQQALKDQQKIADQTAIKVAADENALNDRINALQDQLNQAQKALDRIKQDQQTNQQQTAQNDLLQSFIDRIKLLFTRK